MVGPASTEPASASSALEAVRSALDPAMLRFLSDRRAELAALDPSTAALIDEMVRLVRAGGKRIRPALCYWAFRACGGPEGGSIINAGVALELLHTSALVHDDVMDAGTERRGVPASHVRFAQEAPEDADAGAFGTAAAILVGDLALVLSERALRTSGFEGEVLAKAMSLFDRMRVEMAAGQFLDVSGTAERDHVAALKSGSYTAVGPVLIGAALAGARSEAEGPLGEFARLMGAAFQLRDDVLDGEAAQGSARSVGELLDLAVRALEGAPLEPEGAAALVGLAELLRLRAGS